MVLFGGNTSIVAGTPVHALGDTWTFDGSVWTPHPDATGPAARGYAAMARLGSGVVLNGGAGQGTFVLGDTWLWNGSTWSPESAGGPTARIGASAATLGGNVVLFGGASVAAPSDASLNAIYFNDTWLWNGTGWGSANVSGPPAREYASLAPLDGKLLLFGGQSSGQITESGLLGDTWTWDGSSWTQENALGPTPRCLSATAHVNGAVLLFGGEEDVDDTAILGDTWTWDGTAWTLQSVPGPAARYGASIASFGHGAVLYGGLGLNGLLSDTWIWDSGAWTEIPTQGPPARFGAAMSAE